MLQSGITPAHAGKSGCSVAWHVFVQDHPRTCGEKRVRLAFISGIWGSPPHMRGKGVLPPMLWLWPGITPAHAGKSWYAPFRYCITWDHPRTCGEKYQWKAGADTAIGSPPHMRGKVCVASHKSAYTGITPAHAGKRTAYPAAGHLLEDHPRTCGEKEIKLCAYAFT